jgi:hypothetical protein
MTSKDVYSLAAIEQDGGVTRDLTSHPLLRAESIRPIVQPDADGRPRVLYAQD